MAVEFKTPSETEATQMKEFASIVDSALTILHAPDLAHVSQIVAKKLQEALMWFSHGILNKPVVQAAVDVAEVAAEVTGNAELVSAVHLVSEVETVIQNPVVEEKPIA
jgi:hypothetical protein